MLADQLAQRRLHQRVQDALAKQRAGEPLTNAEETALRKHQLSTEGKHGRNYLRRIPQKDYREFTGVSAKVLYEQGDLYGFEFRGEFLDGAAILRRLHAFFAEEKFWLARMRKLKQLDAMAGEEGEEPLVDWADKCLEEKFYKLRDERREREEQLLPAAAVGELLGRWSAILRTAGDQIGKLSTDAQEVFNDALDACEHLLETTLTVGVDIRNTELHFTAVAWQPDGSGHVCDYGVLPVPSQELGVQPAILAALEAFRDERMATGYSDELGKVHLPRWVLVDAGYKTEVVRAFMRRTELKGKRGYLMVFGRGQSEPPGAGSYTHPDSQSSKVRWIGWQCQVRWHAEHKLFAMFANSDEWKSFVHEGLSAPRGVPGSLSRFEPLTVDERKLANRFARETTAERAKQIVVPRRGAVTVWDNENTKPNHFLDTLYYACCGGYLAGVRVAAVPSATPTAAPERTPPTITMPDGRPFVEAGA